MVVVLHALVAPTSALQVTVRNDLPRTTVSGQILDAHDSKMLFLNGTFYWFAASYGGCTISPGPSGCANVTQGACGFMANHSVSLYTSTDLVAWSDPTVVFTAPQIGAPNAVMASPKALYHAQASEWVLWVNWIIIPGSPAWSESYYAVASSPTAHGPFTLRTQKVATLFPDTGDLNLLADDDGSAYLIYTAHISATAYPRVPNHVMSVEQLAPDWSNTLGAGHNSGVIGASNVEAPMLFKTHPDGLYHAVFGQCCCNDAAGTAALTEYTATSPLGPYTARAVVGTQATLPAQSTDVCQYIDGGGNPAYLYIGDRWQSAPDRILAHDFTLFAPLHLDSQGFLLPIQDLANFTVTIS